MIGGASSSGFGKVKTTFFASSGAVIGVSFSSIFTRDCACTAFEAFYDATFAYAQTVARRMLSGSHEVEDLLAEAKRRIGDQVCFIGGFDQNRYFTTATPEETRAEVRRCFHEAGGGGGLILSPSDHFFEARPELLHAFADEARRCTY